MKTLLADLRFAFRMFSKTPGFVAVAVLTIAIGVGATTSMFSVIYNVFIDPYPYRDPDRIVFFRSIDSEGHSLFATATFDKIRELRKRATTLEDVAFARQKTMVLRAGFPEPVDAAILSPNGLEFMGMPAAVGTIFRERDTAPVVVLGHAFWTRRFRGRPDVIGQVVQLDDRFYTVIGVMPKRFALRNADVYVPEFLPPSSSQFVQIMARRRTGFSTEQVAAEAFPFLTTVVRQGAPNPRNVRIRAVSITEPDSGTFSSTLWILLAAVLLLLLIACGNVANLLLARGTARVHELAIRLSLGAHRGRIVRQLLTESLLLAVFGSALGVAAAYDGVRAIVALLPEYSIPREADIRVNLPVLGFSVLLCLCCGVLFGIVPALHFSKNNLSEGLQTSGRGTDTHRQGSRLRNLLVVAQFALTLVLLSGAGLAIHGFYVLASKPLGYDPSNVLGASLNLPEGRYTTWAERNALSRRLLDELRRIPGIESASIDSTCLPPYYAWRTTFGIPGQTVPKTDLLNMNLVSEGFISALRLPLIRGRLLSEDDVKRNAHVAVVSEDLMKRYWKDRNPIGERVRLDALATEFPKSVALKAPGGDNWYEVVGVAGEIRNFGFDMEYRPSVYIPYGAVLFGGNYVFLRTHGDPDGIEKPLRKKVSEIDRDQVVTRVWRLDQVVSKELLSFPRFSTVLFSIFGGLGLMLAVTGIYSVVSYSVARRTREFGIRIALGAKQADIFHLIFRSVAQLSAIGAALGLAASLALNQILASKLNGIKPGDWAPFAVVIVILLAGAFAGALAPARKAMRVEPMEAVRTE